MHASHRPYHPRSVRLVALSAATAVLLLGLPGAAAADDETSDVDTVVGTLVQAWPEYEELAEATEHGDDGPLSWVEPDDGDAVRVATEDVQDLEAGATVEVALGDEVEDAATEEGLEPAREVLAAEVLEPAPTTPEPSAPAPAAPPFTNSVTVVMVVPAGGTQDGTTLADVVTEVNGPVADFWEEETNGRIKVGVTAQHDWITTTAGCEDPDALWDEVATDVGFVAGQEKHLLLYVSSTPAALSGCAYGLAELGGPSYSGGSLYVRDVETSVIAHELGHNFGLGHASSRQCSRSPYSGACYTGEYADFYDVMGYSWDQVGSLNVIHADRLNATQTVKPFMIGYPTESVTLAPVSQWSGYRGIEIDAQSGRYWLEYRPAAGRDAWLGTADNVLGLQSGVLLRLASGGDDSSLLLDGTPSPQADWASDFDVALPVGTPIQIPGGQYGPGRITVTVQSVSGAGAVVRLEGQGADLAGDNRCASRPNAPSSSVSLLETPGGPVVLGVGGDRGVWFRPVDGPSAWYPLGGGVLYGPTAVAAGSKYYLFAVGTDHTLYFRFHNGSSWQPWTSLGGYLTSSPAAASLGTGHVRVFVRGGDGSMWSREFRNGAWSGWNGHDGYLSSPPTATADPDQGLIEVGFRGGDGNVYTQYLAAGETDDSYYGGYLAVCSALALSPVRAATDPADGAYLDGNGAPRLLDGWSSRPLGGWLTANPAVQFVGEHVLLAGRGGDGGLWLYDGRPGHGGWVGLGGYLL